MDAGAIGPHGDPAIAIIAADGVCALQRACRLLAHPELAANGNVRFLHSAFHIAGVHVERTYDVGGNAVGRAVSRTILEALITGFVIRVDNRYRIGLDGLIVIQNVRQDLIFHINKIHSLLRQFFRLSSNQRHRLAGPEGAVCSEHGGFWILIPVDTGFCAGQNVQHALQRLRLGRIDFQDLCVCVGTALGFDVSHVGELIVIVAGIQSLTGNLVIGVNSLFAFSD